MKYYSAEAIMVADYYQFPKWLKKIKVSSDAKLLYVYLFDRYRLSLKNGWVDKENRVYLICPRSEMQELLDCSKGTAIKAARALEEAGLIEEKRVPNEANRIYLLMPSYSEEAEKDLTASNDEDVNNESRKFKNWTSKNCTSGGSKSGLPEVQNLNPSNNYSSKNNKSKNYYSNDNDIENTLNVVGEAEESVVVNKKFEPSSFLSPKEIRTKAKAIQDANVLANESYNCFEDPMFSDSLEYDSTRKALLDFAQYHENAKDFPFFKLKDIAPYWTRTAEVYRNPETVVKAEKMLLKVMNSFTKPAEKLAILSMDTEDILYLLKNLQKYYNSDEESNIVNPQTWTAGSIRPMISAKVYEISGAQI